MQDNTYSAHDESQGQHLHAQLLSSLKSRGETEGPTLEVPANPSPVAAPADAIDPPCLNARHESQGQHLHAQLLSSLKSRGETEGPTLEVPANPSPVAAPADVIDPPCLNARHESQGQHLHAQLLSSLKSRGETEGPTLEVPANPSPVAAPADVIDPPCLNARHESQGQHLHAQLLSSLKSRGETEGPTLEVPANPSPVAAPADVIDPPCLNARHESQGQHLHAQLLSSLNTGDQGPTLEMPPNPSSFAAAPVASPVAPVRKSHLKRRLVGKQTVRQAGGLPRLASTVVRARLGHLLQPAERGFLVRVHGDGWGGGTGSYLATVTEADTQTFTVIRRGDCYGSWDETHVLKTCCSIMARTTTTQEVFLASEGIRT